MRLTERFENGQVGVRGCGNNCKYGYIYCNNASESCPELATIYRKLAEFEDIKIYELTQTIDLKHPENINVTIEERDLAPEDLLKIGKTVFLSREDVENYLEEIYG